MTRVFGVELPVIQAPMAGVQGSALAIAVSKAGGLGSLPCALLSPEAMRKELGNLRASTQQPYNVNFFCHAQPVPDAARERAWRERLAPYYRELGLDPAGIPEGAGRAAFDAAAAGLLAEFRPPVVSFHFGLPAPDLVARIRSWGAKVIASATTLEEARWLEGRGVDAIIAQGSDAGGHRGMFLSDDLRTQVDTVTLVKQLARATKVPVIAAGGIASAASVKAMLKLGAAAVQVGTAYLLCPEATTTTLHRAALKGKAGRSTAITNVYTGRPARGIVNRAIRELGPISTLAPQFPLASTAMAPLRAKAEAAGSDDFSPMWAGTDASGCREIPAAQLTRELAA